MNQPTSIFKNKKVGQTIANNLRPMSVLLILRVHLQHNRSCIICTYASLKRYTSTALLIYLNPVNPCKLDLESFEVVSIGADYGDSRGNRNGASCILVVKRSISDGFITRTLPWIIIGPILIVKSLFWGTLCHWLWDICVEVEVFRLRRASTTEIRVSIMGGRWNNKVFALSIRPIIDHLAIIGNGCPLGYQR